MCKVIDAQDSIGKARDLAEAIFMAASDISDRKQMSALHAVADILDDVLTEANELLQTYRDERDRKP